MMKKSMLMASALAGAALSLNAANVVPPTGGTAISDHLIGIFFEDISSSADGGLNAELLPNGSFEYNANERDGWGPLTQWHIVRPGHSLGRADVRMDNTLHPNNPTYIRLYTERVGHYYDFNGWTGFGLSSHGFDSLSVKAGEKYDASLYLRNVDAQTKKVRIVLATGGRNPEVLADTVIECSDKEWKQYAVTLEPKASSTRANLQVLMLTPGNMDVDMISLIPQDTYHGHGLRRDLCEALEALHPAFMRFPGGCVVHGGGDGFWNTYRWKETVGPKYQRKGQKNTWGYHQSMALGYFEYFQLCEDMKMQPLPILPCGVSCQGANGGWFMKTQAQDLAPMEEMDEWVNEALDLIEWANGDVTTKWGKVRAEAGHPEPFGLKYLGIGNEEKITEGFAERFRYIYNKVHAAHPEIIVVGTAGPGSHPDNGDYKAGWKLAEELELPILDEHYYEQRTYFEEQRQYDSYPRNRKTKVYLGEYAAKDKKLADALAEALYLLHVEKNGDVVEMTSYAPLFARKGGTSWNPDLIYFDNDRVYPTCSYYVQQFFGESAGQYYYGDCVTFTEPAEKANLQGQSVILNTQKRELYVKICNDTDKATKANVNLSRFAKGKSATITTLSGQPMDENNYEAQPVQPQTSTLKPARQLSLDLAPYSFTFVKIKL